MANEKKKKTKELLMTQAGEFYLGSLTKSGALSADSVRISDDEIMKMLAAWFEKYCGDNSTDTLWIKTSTGAILVKNLTEAELQQGLMQQKTRQGKKNGKAKPAPKAAPKPVKKSNTAAIPRKSRSQKQS